MQHHNSGMFRRSHATSQLCSRFSLWVYFAAR